MLQHWKVEHERRLGLQPGLESFTEDALGDALIVVAEDVSMTVGNATEACRR